MRMMQGPRRLAAQQVGVQRRHRPDRPTCPTWRTPAARCGLSTAPPTPSLTAAVRIGGDLGRTIARQRLGHCLGGQHAGLHRCMRALDLRHVQEPRRVADQQPARETQLRDRLQPALVQRSRAVGDPPPALEMLPHRRVGLEPLHLVERRQPWIAVVQPDDKAVRHQVLPEMIQERPAVGGAIQRPSEAVLDQAGLVIGGGDFPQFLDPDRIGLRIAPFTQIEPLHQLLATRAAAALGEQRVVARAVPCPAGSFRSAGRPCRCPCRRWRCRRCGRLPPAVPTAAKPG